MSSNKLSTAVLIPARMASTRLPGKMLVKICGESVISRTYRAVVDSNLFDYVCVVTDSTDIKNEIESIGGFAVLSSKRHESGSDRIAEAAKNMDFDIIINVQGDEPFINKEALNALLMQFDNTEVEVASIMQEINSNEDIFNSNNVKVVCDNNNYAMYFSRSPIPFNRDSCEDLKYYKHIGVYAFRKQALLHFTSLKQSNLEKAEKLEQLRMLQNGIKIKMAVVDTIGVEIDVAEDIEKAENYLKAISKMK